MTRAIALFELLALTTLAAASEPDRAVIQRAVESGLTVLERGAKAYPSNESCFSCHHQTLPLLAMKSAHRSGMHLNTELFREQIEFTRKSFTERRTRLANGEHIGGRAATVSYGLWALSIGGESPDLLSEAMTSYLLRVQQPDGSWKPQSNRPPIESSIVSCTVLTAWMLREFAAESQREKSSTAIGRAKAWLSTVSLEEQEDFNFALWSEGLLGDSAARIVELRRKIVNDQQPDGGWRQTRALTSDAYATGQTLYILSETGVSASEASFRKGVEFLLRTQQPDGSWHVASRSKPIQPWFDNGDPHGKDQFISITATGWATAALTKSLTEAN